MCIRIYANAGGGIGTEVFTFGAKEALHARVVLNNIVKLRFRNIGIKDGLSLAMVKTPKATAMLIEICFVYSLDVDLYNTLGLEVIAAEIVSGLTVEFISIIKGTWILDDTG